MAFFQYQAFSKEGKKINGKMEAQNMQQAKAELLGKGLYPIFVIPEQGLEKKENFLSSWFAPTMSLSDKIFFTKLSPKA